MIAPPEPSRLRTARPQGHELTELRTRLENYPEPVALRLKLRDIARGDPALAQSEAVRLFAAWLWRRWRPELGRFGFAPRDLRSLLEGDRRELWLWVMGDRVFTQLLEGVVGRTLRRLAGPPL